VVESMGEKRVGYERRHDDETGVVLATRVLVARPEIAVGVFRFIAALADELMARSGNLPNEDPESVLAEDALGCGLSKINPVAGPNPVPND
jgi:hypothetical protein